MTLPPKWPVRPKAGRKFVEDLVVKGILAFLSIPPKW